MMVVTSCQNKPNKMSDDQLWELALKICENNIILDSHIDWPERIYYNPGDISLQYANGDFDLIRSNKGGLNAVLSVLYINSNLSVDEGRVMVDSLLKLVTNYNIAYPDKFAPAFSPNDIKNNFMNKLFSIPICLENGSPIGNDLEYLNQLKEQGIVYITLNHNKANQISDSNFDTNLIWNGLSPFGLELIKEMNRLGIIIDISHSTDSTVFQSLRYSKAPIVATHSNCRYFTPGFERNLSDTLIKAIASKNGVIMVNFGSFFLDSICLKNWSYLLFEAGIDISSQEGIEFAQKYGETHKLFSNSQKVVDHIDHIVGLVGIDYVGIGSDYDGIYIAQPTDLPDVSSYPIIVYELLKRGYAEEDIRKILSGNFLRVWENVLEVSEAINNNTTH